MSGDMDTTQIVETDREAARLLSKMLPEMVGSTDALMFFSALLASLEASADTIERLQKELDFRRELDSMPDGKPE